MDFYTTPFTRSAAKAAVWGVPVFMGMEFFSISMDRFLTTADRKCSLHAN
ncbi:hypothetical protein [Paracidovorax sp. MALMAid1276]